MQKNARRPEFLPLVALLTGLLGFGSGCTPSGPKALLQGEELIRKGKYEAAVEKLELATNLLPNEARAWNYLGMARHQAGDFADARLAYERALRLDRDLAAARFNLGKMYMEQGVPISALEQLSTFVMLDPKSVEGWVLMGNANLELLRYDQAEESFYAALRLERNTPEAYNGIGLIQMERDSPREAYRFFVEALKHDPNFAPAILNLAVVLHTKLDAKPLALAKYREYLSKAPAGPDVASVRSVAERLNQDLNPPLEKAVQPVQIASVDTNSFKVRDAGEQAASAVTTNAVASNAAGGGAEQVTKATGTATNVTQSPLTNTVAASPKASEPTNNVRVASGTVTGRTNTTASAATTSKSTTTNVDRADSTRVVENKPSAGAETSGRDAERSVPADKTGPASGQELKVATTTPPKQTNAPVVTKAATPVSEDSKPANQLNTAQSDKIPVTAPNVGETSPEPEIQDEAPLEVVQLKVEEIQPPQEMPVAQESPDEPAPQPVEPARSEPGLPVDNAPELATASEDAGDVDRKKGFFQKINPANLFRGKEESGTAARTDELITPLPSRGGSDSGTLAPPESTTDASRQVARADYTEVTPIGSGGRENRYGYTISGPPAPGDRAASERLFQRGLDAQTSMDPGRAASYFASASMADPSYFPAQYNLGLLSYQTGQIMKSLSAFETALALDPNSADARYNFALALQKAHYPMDAVDELTRLLERYPGHVSGHLLLGNVYAQDLDNVERARSEYQTVLELDPGHRQAPVIRAWLNENP